jgi:S-adenosylmethionine hydrolase
MLVHVIADYGNGDLAFAEVIQRIKYHLPDAETVPTPVAPFATLAAGFCIAQLALNQAPPGTIVYHNVAPREDEQRARQANSGERLAFARLPTGVRVIGVNAGYAFSFLRDVADELRWAAAPAQGSQFRSRDLFPQAAAAIATGQPDALSEPLSDDEIPQVPQRSIAYVDGYGNVKTTIQAGHFKEKTGTRVWIAIDGSGGEATVAGASFAVETGKMALAPGSSGWPDGGGGEVRWMELFLRGGSAWEAFGRPPIGARVDVRLS